MAPHIAEGYIPILLLGVVAILLVFVTLLLSKFLAPKNATARKLTPYECGEIQQGSGRGPIEVQYYMYIIVFLILDVEAVFLLPFAVRFLDLGISGLIEMGIFVGLLVLGWFYALRKGALEWVR